MHAELSLTQVQPQNLTRGRALVGGGLQVRGGILVGQPLPALGEGRLGY